MPRNNHIKMLCVSPNAAHHSNSHLVIQAELQDKGKINKFKFRSLCCFQIIYYFSSTFRNNLIETSLPTNAYHFSLKQR